MTNSEHRSDRQKIVLPGDLRNQNSFVYSSEAKILFDPSDAGLIEPVVRLAVTIQGTNQLDSFSFGRNVYKTKEELVWCEDDRND